MLRGYRGYRVWVWNSKLTRWQPLSKNIYARAYEADYVAKLAELAKKIVPTGGTTQDQEAEAVLSCV